MPILLREMVDTSSSKLILNELACFIDTSSRHNDNTLEKLFDAIIGNVLPFVSDSLLKTILFCRSSSINISYAMHI